MTAVLEAEWTESECEDEYVRKPNAEAEISRFAEDFFSDAKFLARQYVEKFFGDKSLHCGGRIPKSFLHNDRRVQMVLNYNIVKGVGRAYNALEKGLTREEIEHSRKTGEATSDIKLVNETLNLLARSGVPQQFAGGMMCLYLEFVEGIDIGHQP